MSDKKSKIIDQIKHLVDIGALDDLSIDQLMQVAATITRTDLPVSVSPALKSAQVTRCTMESLLPVEEVVLYNSTCISKEEAVACVRGEKQSPYIAIFEKEHYDALFHTTKASTILVEGVECRMSKLAFAGESMRCIEVLTSPKLDMSRDMIQGILSAFQVDGEYSLSYSSADEFAHSGVSHRLIITDRPAVSRGDVPTRLSVRNMMFLDLRADGVSLTEIGARFGITGTGVSQHINAAIAKMRRYGLDAIKPYGYEVRHTEEELLATHSKRRAGHSNK